MADSNYIYRVETLVLMLHGDVSQLFFFYCFFTKDGSRAAVIHERTILMGIKKKKSNAKELQKMTGI